jgi:toxin ParE1/3/4
MPAAVLSTAAKHDMAEVVVSLTRYSAGNAQRFKAEVDRACRTLAHSPRMGKPRDDLAAGLLSHPGPRQYLIFYRITDGGIRVERIIHGARRIDPSMFE